MISEDFLRHQSTFFFFCYHQFISARMGPTFPGDRVEYDDIHCIFLYLAFPLPSINSITQRYIAHKFCVSPVLTASGFTEVN